jgi:hypothetical protein
MQARLMRLWQKLWLLCAVLVFASLAVAAPPANDNFANARVISGDTGQFNGTNQEATVESGEPPHFVSGAAASVWYRWTAPRNGEMVFKLDNILPAGIAPTLAVYTGSSVDNLTLLTHVNGSQELRLNAVAGATYSLVVATYYQTPVTFTFKWQAIPPPPAPSNDNFAQAQLIEGISSGASGSCLSATAEMGEPAGQTQSVWYRWQVPGDGRFRFVAEGMECRVYRGTSLDSLSLIASDGGFDATADEYLYIAVNGSRNFYLRWGLLDPNANDDRSAAQIISGTSGKVAGSNVGATSEDGNENEASVWYQWTAPSSGYVLFTTPSDFPLQLFYGGEVTKEGILLNAVAGQTYVFRVNGKVRQVYYSQTGYYYVVTRGEFILRWNPVFPEPPANDNFASAQPISGTQGRVSGTTVIASWEAGEPKAYAYDYAALVSIVTESSVWYRWEVPVTGRYAFRSQAKYPEGFVNVPTLYTGDTLNALTAVAPGSSGYDLTAGTIIHIMVHSKMYSAWGSTPKYGSEFDLFWALRPANDDYADAETIYGSSGEKAGTCVGASGQPSDGVTSGSTATVWYKWTAPISTKMEFRFDTSQPTASTFELAIFFYSGNSALATGTRSGTNTTNARFDAHANNVYWIRVRGGEENFRFYWQPAPPPPPPVLSMTIDPYSDSFGETSQLNAIGTITRTGDALEDLNITLTNSHPSAVNVPQTVTILRGNSSVIFPIEPINNLVADGTRNVTITANVTNPAGVEPASATVVVRDDDVAFVDVLPTSLLTTESGGRSTFRVVLKSQPSANVTVRLASTNRAEGTVSPAQLTFTPQNWNVSQPAIVTGVDDGPQASGNQTYSIVTTVQSSDAIYSAVNPPDVQVVNADNDRAGIMVSPTSGLTTDESGSAANFYIVLNSRPTSDVSIALNSTHAGEGELYFDYRLRTFTPTNWRIPQLVRVRGGRDDVVDGNIKYRIVTAPAQSLDPQYQGLNPPDVELTNLDLNRAEIIVTRRVSYTTENGRTTTFQIGLSSRPASPVTIFLLSTNTNEGIVSPSTITFTPGVQWANVVVTGVDDDVIDGDKKYWILTAPAQSLDRNYHNYDPLDIELTNFDNDQSGLLLAFSANQVEGSSFSGTVTRSSNTHASQEVTLRSSDPTTVSVPATVTFPAGIAVVGFTVNTTNDEVGQGPRTVTITATSSGLIARRDVTVTDDEAYTPQLTLRLSSSTVAENATAPLTATITRNTPATSPITFTLLSTDTGEAQVPATITIPAGRSSATFLVTPQDDTRADGSQRLNILATAPDYSQLVVAPLTVTDNEVPQLSLTLNSNRIAENGMATATLSRNSEVTSVTPALGVSLTANVAGQLTVPTRVVIPLGATSVSFPVRAVDDNVADGPREVTLTARATGFVEAASRVIVLDNEAASNGILSGKVLLPALQNSVPVPGAVMTLRRGTAILDRVLTGVDGTYTFRALPPGTYTIAPTKASYAFAPLTRTASLTTAVKTVGNLNFVGVPRAQIAGVVTRFDATGKPQNWAGINVQARGTLGTFSTRTNSNGQFVFDRLPLGTYLVTPAVPGRAFNPKLRLVTLSAAAPVVAELTFGAAARDIIAPTVLVRTPGGNVTESTKSTLTASGSAADNSGGSGVLSVTVAVARFSGTGSTVPNGFLNWSNQSFATSDSAAIVEALAGGTTSWSLNGAALAALRGLPAGSYGVRATVSDGAGNVTRSAWKRFSITSTTRQYEEEPISTPVAGSPVRLSGAVATTQQVTLRFSGPLESASASDVANYAVEIGGRVIEIESVAYANGVVRLGLAEVAVPAGTNLSVKWRNLRDAQGRLVPSAATMVIAR